MPKLFDAPEPAPDMDSLWDWLPENCVLCDQSSAGLGTLHLDFARWCAARSVPNPGTRDRFREMLRGEGFEAAEHSTGEVMVTWLILECDYEAAFDRPAPSPGKLQPDGTLLIELKEPAKRQRRPAA
jgi:hypothetical protein